MFRAGSLILASCFVLATAFTAVVAHAAGKDGVAAKTRASKVVTTGTCITNQSTYAASTLDGSSTTSTSFVNLGEGAVTFQQGLGNGCAIVNFSSMAFAASGGSALLYVRALLDGATVAIPFETQFTGDDDEDGDGRWARSHSYTFIFPRVAPGLHTVQMQFRSFDGGSVTLHRHTTVVQHRR